MVPPVVVQAAVSQLFLPHQVETDIRDRRLRAAREARAFGQRHPVRLCFLCFACRRIRALSAFRAYATSSPRTGSYHEDSRYPGGG
jgi:hypothetical protein